VARVGLSETEARKKGIAFDVTKYGLDDLDRAITDSEDSGFIKVLTPPGKDKNPRRGGGEFPRRRNSGGVHSGDEARPGVE